MDTAERRRYQYQPSDAKITLRLYAFLPPANQSTAQPEQTMITIINILDATTSELGNNLYNYVEHIDIDDDSERYSRSAGVCTNNGTSKRLSD
ncbi:hypothetical protein RP20_CCG009363 [Aedes albopictus]|nr:hypothetical protein RP20_CCG009363 [Aedes albopictus]